MEQLPGILEEFSNAGNKIREASSLKKRLKSATTSAVHSLTHMQFIKGLLE
jgi:hypothetical protein